MDFATIGKISSFVKTKNLMFAANYKIKTGQTLTNANGNLVSTNAVTFDKLRDAAKTGQTKAKQAKLQRIKQKLLQGKKISEEELAFLRANDPKLYNKAKAADDAREDLKEDLKKAKSKEEAREAMTRAMVKASTEAMAELSSLGQGGGSALAGGGGAAMQAGGDVGAMNFSGDGGIAMQAGGEVSAASNGAEGQTFTEANQSIQSAGEKATDALTSANQDANKTSTQDGNKTSLEKNSAAQKSSDGELNTPEDIMEKYLMKIRALEDEWAKFTNSKEYKDLPEHTLEESETVTNKKNRRQVDAPNRKVLEAATLYRKAMLYSLA